MDTNALKKFAQAARNSLMAQVGTKLGLVLEASSAARREYPNAVRQLESVIARAGKTQVTEEVAYTWFNRFTALRFMDACGYTTVGAVSPADGQTRPELLAEAMAGNMPEGAPALVAALLDGRSPSHDPQGEAYRLLLVAVCNQWHGFMPFMFEAIDDYTELLMPEDLLSSTSILAELRKVMTEDACQDVEIIGWLYQFYISEKKDQVFAGLKKNHKITAENIPAATQLFTPHWIVRYLVENSLGRLWLLNRPGSKLVERMDYYIAPEEAETDFLRITRPEEIRICDPACGSGHMLTYAFDLLHAIYEEEGYEATEIPGLILTHNLTGVEIDDRAGALAAFALAMKAAARLGRRRFLRMEVKPDICVLQNVVFTPAEVQDVALVVGEDLFTDELCETLGQFEQAKNFGSLIVPKLRDSAKALRKVEARIEDADLILKPVLTHVVEVLRMAEALSSRYHVVVANPPYMGGKGMNGDLGKFAKYYFPDSKADLYAMFIERALALSLNLGTAAQVNMQAWMFLTSYEKLRVFLSDNVAFLNMAHIGERGFDSIGGAVVSTTACVMQKRGNPAHKGEFVRLVDAKGEREKSEKLRKSIQEQDGDLYRASIEDFRSIPGRPLVYWSSDQIKTIFRESDTVGEHLDIRQGMATTDNNRFLRLWSEISLNKIGFGFTRPEDANKSDFSWFPFNKGGEFRRWYGNIEHVVNYQNGGSVLIDLVKNKYPRISDPEFVIKNRKYYFRECVSWSDITTGGSSYRYVPSGHIFDVCAPSAFSIDEISVSEHLCMLNSNVTTKIGAMLNPSLHFTLGDLKRMPYAHSDTAVPAGSLIKLSKFDWDAYETSWEFTTLPLLNPDHRAGMLESSYTALRAHWQGMTDEMQRLEEKNNRIFIDAYGLQNELTPEVPLNEITLTCNPAYRYGIKTDAEANETRLRADTMAEFLSYAVGCMFGRYSLDAPGLILANKGETLADYLARVPEPTFMPAEDNVIPVLDGDWFADDITERFRLFLRRTFGELKFRENLAFIEDALGKDIRRYFTRDFFASHVQRYKKRPIYWLVSSPKGTFNALIYLHRYRPDTVSVLLNNYLREFITKLEGHRTNVEKQSDDPSLSQGQRTKALKEIATIATELNELHAWERDVVFPMAQQRIEIDLDDGVKANYPKFDRLLKPIKGLEVSDE